ncbi:MAG: ABC transporter ATP-binding protein [Planctomycetota bacterium]
MTDEHSNNGVVLTVEDLRTVFDVEGGTVRAVDGAGFAVRRGEILAIVGESGCGKSVTAYSVLRLIQPPGRIEGGRIRLHGGNDDETLDILSLDEKDERLFHIRGGRISMIFQEPMTALSPVHTIGNQICEAILLHQDVTPAAAEGAAVAMLAKVGIPGAERCLKRYPHELSGGMRQRAVIAMALVCRPELLIADEPTTALDVTIQAQILRLIKQLQADLGMAVLLITHDIGVVAQTAQRVAVMYLGRIVEQAPVRDLITSPRHSYTHGLLQSLPGLHTGGRRLQSIRGSLPGPLARPAGCPFHPRCDRAVAGRCDVGDPPALRRIAPGRDVACVLAQEDDL